LKILSNDLKEKGDDRGREILRTKGSEEKEGVLSVGEGEGDRNEKEREEAVSRMCSRCPEHLLTADLLSALERAGYHFVLRDFYIRVKDFDRAIMAHLAGTENKASVFPFIDNILLCDSTAKARGVILSHFEIFCSIDEILFSNVLSSHFLHTRRIASPEEASLSLSLLRKHPKLYYHFLSSASADRSKRPYLNEEEGDLLVELMCAYEPRKVKEHLVKSDNYRPLQCLQYVTKYHIFDAKSFLLEKLGDYPASLDALLTHFSHKSNAFLSLCRLPLSLPDGKESERRQLLQESKDVMSESRSLCVRSSQKEAMGRKEMENLWEKLIESLSHFLSSVRAMFSKCSPPHSVEYQMFVVFAKETSEASDGVIL
jgi:hypothetical protein